MVMIMLMIVMITMVIFKRICPKYVRKEFLFGRMTAVVTLWRAQIGSDQQDKCLYTSSSMCGAYCWWWWWWLWWWWWSTLKEFAKRLPKGASRWEDDRPLCEVGCTVSETAWTPPLVCLVYDDDHNFDDCVDGYGHLQKNSPRDGQKRGPRWEDVHPFWGSGEAFESRFEALNWA